MLTSRYVIAGSNIVSEAFDGDIVVLDLDTGRYFSFTDTGGALWAGLVEGVAPAALLVPGGSVTQDDLRGFLQQLLDYQLIVAGAAPAADPVPAAILEQLGASGEKPEISVFDDLADLFLADPIHDVARDAGWPVLEGN